MRVLLISMSPINRALSVGNTFLNLFDNMQNVEICSLYMKPGMPDPCVSMAYRCTDTDIAKHLFRHRKSVGGWVTKRADAVPAHTDSRRMRFAKRIRLTAFFMVRDWLWKTDRWQTPELQHFLEEAKPDILFTMLNNSIAMNHLIRYVQKQTNKPLFVYAWDNNYTMRAWGSPIRLIYHLSEKRYMRDTVHAATKLYVISAMQKADYEKAFGKSCTVITKGADFSSPPPLKIQSQTPVKFVYTGNVSLNRWKSLAVIVDALHQINADDLHAQIFIYTANPLTAHMMKRLHKPPTAYVMGNVPASEVDAVQQDADVLVHVEAMDRKNRYTVRHSFSTKLVDYFRQARPIFAYGPAEVASVYHLLHEDAAIVAQNRSEVFEKLQMLLDDPSLLRTYGEKAYACGERCHSLNNIMNILKDDFNTAQQPHE